MFDPNLTKQHYKSVIFASYLHLLREQYPNVDIAVLAKDAGLSLDYITNENNWVSITYEKRLMDLILLRTEDPGIFLKAGHYGISKTGLGSSLYFLASNVIPLDAIYKSLPRMTPLLNKVMDVQIVSFKEGEIKFTFTPKIEGLSPEEAETLMERMPIVMENTKGYYSAIPTLKRLPFARAKTYISDTKLSQYTLEISYFAQSEILGKVMHSAPLAAGLITLLLERLMFSYSWGTAIMSSLLASMSLFALSMAFAKRQLVSTAALAEESLYSLDTQNKNLYETQGKLKRKLEETQAIFQLVSRLVESATEEETVQLGCETLVDNLGYDRAFILLADSQGESLSVSGAKGVDDSLKTLLTKLKLPIDIDDHDPSKFSNVFRYRRPLLAANVQEHVKTLKDPLSRQVLEASKSQSFVAAPVCTQTKSLGILVADCITRNKIMTEADLQVISTAAYQIAIAIEQQRSKQALVEAYQNELNLSESYSRFVPFETLKMLNYKDIFDVKIGDGVEHNVAVLFSDIRDFTSLCETMTPREILLFLNSYYARMSPIVKTHNGIIDKYMGDGVMALFPTMTEAIHAAIEIQRNLVQYNLQHRVGSRKPIKAGVGIASGPVVFGPLGSDKRLNLTAISDTVNVASRLDGLCRSHDADIMITGLEDSQMPQLPGLMTRHFGLMEVKGKSNQLPVIEIVDSGLLDKIIQKDLNSTQSQYYGQMKIRLEEKLKSSKAA